MEILFSVGFDTTATCISYCYVYMLLLGATISVYGCLPFVSECEGKSILKFCLTISSQSLNLRGCRGTADDVATIPFHPSMSSATLREFHNPIPIYSLFDIQIVNFHDRYLRNIVDKVAANPLYSRNGVDGWQSGSG